MLGVRGHVLGVEGPVSVGERQVRRRHVQVSGAGVGEGSEVFIWDVRALDCIHRFADEGSLKGTAIAGTLSYMIYI